MAGGGEDKDSKHRNGLKAVKLIRLLRQQGAPDDPRGGWSSGQSPAAAAAAILDAPKRRLEVRGGEALRRSNSFAMLSEGSRPQTAIV
jgi:hypothetical protein